MDEDAIQSDVSEVSTEGQQPVVDQGAEKQQEQEPARPVSERERMLEEIADRLYTEEVSPEEDEEGAAPVEAPELPQPERDEKGRFVKKEEREPIYTVKVDGEEKELPLNEILKGYQKDATASRRLEEAALARKQLEQEWARLQEERAKLTTPAAPAVEQPPEPPADPKADARKLYESLMLGDEQAGIDALADFIAKREPLKAEAISVDVDQVATQAAAKARLELEYSTAERAFRKEYEDLARDPDLYQLAMSALQTTAPQSSTYDEAFKKAGDQTREWVKAKAEAMGFVYKAPESKRQEKIARKQSLDSVQTAKARVPAPVEEREPTASEVIAEIRKSRGLSY